MITLLLIVICLAVLTQPNANRLFAALVFAGLTLAHDLYLSDLDGLAYYGSAALMDLAIIILTSGIYPVPAMVVRLHQICLFSIIANCAGWVMWQAYLPPTVYDAMFVFIYIWAVIAMIKKDSGDVGGYSMDSWRANFRFNRAARVSLNAQDKSPS